MGKNTKKESQTESEKRHLRRKRRKALRWVFPAVIVLLLAVIVLLLVLDKKEQEPVSTQNIATASIEGFTDADGTQPYALSEDLEICRTGYYTGAFIEQGTNLSCSGTSALVVHNTSDSLIEKAILQRGSERFVITYLPADGLCLVQEQTGNSGIAGEICIEELTYAEEPSMHTDRVEILADENGVSIRNVSGKDIPGSVNVWYKTLKNGLYFGGVSYKAAVDDGVLKAESTATVQTAHYDPEGSEILLVTFTE